MILYLKPKVVNVLILKTLFKLTKDKKEIGVTYLAAIS